MLAGLTDNAVKDSMASSEFESPLGRYLFSTHSIMETCAKCSDKSLAYPHDHLQSSQVVRTHVLCEVAVHLLEALDRLRDTTSFLEDVTKSVICHVPKA